MDKEFCLLDEPWIKILDETNSIREVSLMNLFENAHRYKRLVGETVTQDVSVFRLLLSIAVTVFYRYNIDGGEDNILEYDDPEEEILERWSDYWEKGVFDFVTFRKYLETYRERFYLFHPKTPFWQVANLKNGTDYEIINLYGNVKESNNKASKHHFHMIDGQYIDNISYAEVARWIIYNNAYSINVKTNVDGVNKPTGVGRLGQLGLIAVEEDTIYKTILINLCALNSNGEAWGEPRPTWEQEPRINAGIEIVPPDNLPELFTIQSRRLLIQRDNNKILGFRSIGGDYYSTVNDLVEPMTLLKWDGKENFKPRKHEKAIAAWREFPSLLVEKDSESLTPGLVRWIEELIENCQLNKKQVITFHMIGLEYGDGMSYTNGEIIDELLSVSKEIVNQNGVIWRKLIIDEVKNCEDVVQKGYYRFAQILAVDLFEGDNKKAKSIKNTLSTTYYYKIDKLFREWLISIEPGKDKQNEKEMEWQKLSLSIAESVVRDYISNISPRYVMICIRAVDAFKKELNKIYFNMKKKGETHE